MNDRMRNVEVGFSPETKEITNETLSAYIEGCESIALKLDTSIEKTIEAGKRPVILIPSRGAVPIFLLARRFLSELRGEDSFLNEKNATYYPKGVFDFLEGEQPQESGPDTKVDVILYPFTADVSLETNGDETIARELRNSCARSVMQLTRGIDYRQHDLEWYKYLMGKLQENPDDSPDIKPQNVLQSLASIQPKENAQIILIDTVISGRAANDITNAFKALGHTVIPLLAVDSTKGGKFDRRRKWEIEETLRPIWNLTPEGGPFEDFPLVSEDKGAALLGVVALNVINFNEVGIFNRINNQLPFDFRPQSCVWTLPPPNVRSKYLNNFRNFLEMAWRSRNGSQNIPTEEEIKAISQESRSMTASHEAPHFSEISALLPIDKESELKETASHIISVRLPKKQADDWVKEFSGQIPHSAP